MPVSQTAATSRMRRRQASPAPWLPVAVLGSSSLLIPRSHSFMCSARILDAPPLRPFVSSPTASRTSESVGTPSGIGAGSTLMGRGSPGGVLPVYKAIRSAVWRSIVWGHGRASTSVAARYHPFSSRNASWTSPPLSLASIDWPTLFVRSMRSTFREFQISLFIRRPPARHSRPVRRSIVRCATNFHVAVDIQSLRGCCLGSGWSQSAFNSSKRRVFLSCSPGGSVMGNRWRLRQ